MAALVGTTVTAVRRKGKYMWLECASGAASWTGEKVCVLIHLGMAGWINVKGEDAVTYIRIKQNGVWPPKFVKLQLEFEDGTALALSDGRRFARVKLQSEPEASDPVNRLGRDAYLDLPSREEFGELIGRQNRVIKAVLLDQGVLSGLGNWVADEVLYHARIFPESPCADLDAAQLDALHAAIRDVLDVAVAADADYTRFPKAWLFHFRRVVSLCQRCSGCASTNTVMRISRHTF